jgi:ATP-dependent RNA helicase DDX10/DBP4
LVLDEADRILDLGFSKTLNAILENLPSGRQTMVCRPRPLAPAARPCTVSPEPPPGRQLFSATQSKSVKDLARLSLASPLFISVHEKEKVRMAAGLFRHRPSPAVKPLQATPFFTRGLFFFFSFSSVALRQPPQTS